MSGICGWIHWNGAPVSPAGVAAMLDPVAYRGPDGRRTWHGEGIALGHLALHVTPEDERDRQPLRRWPDEIVLVADARIDNRDELVARLGEGRLAGSRDPTDAELILASYRHWGDNCAAHLIGDFAFAVWDGRRRRLFAARDPMGMRALYFRSEDGRFLFATELKQILAVSDVPAHPFEPAIAAYLAGSPGREEWSFYDGISQLPAGHALIADRAGVRTDRYWEIDPKATIEYADEAEYAEAFREVFAEAVRCRLRTRAPAGISLSGGLDSGSIAATAGWLRERGEIGVPELRAYCHAYRVLQQFDERHISDRIAQRYGIPVTAVPADEAWPLRDRPGHGTDVDEPLTGVFQPLLERQLTLARREGMRSMLSGDRGDLVVGDSVFDALSLLESGRWGRLFEELRLHSEWMGYPIGRAVRRLLVAPTLSTLWPIDRAAALRGRVRRLYHGILDGAAANGDDGYPPWLRREFVHRTGLDEIDREPGSLPRLDGPARRARHQLIFCPTRMRLMVWAERTQARFGLSFADPWSDRRLASFVLAIPQRMVQRSGRPKHLAREAMRGVMPEGARRRPSKTSPAPLYLESLRHHGRAVVEALIGDSVAANLGYLAEDRLERHYESIRRGDAAHPAFWNALTLEMWLREHGRSPCRDSVDADVPGLDLEQYEAM